MDVMLTSVASSGSLKCEHNNSKLSLQVFAIELVTFAVDFVPLAVEFSTFAVEFVALALQFIALAMELDVFAIELGAFALEFVAFAQILSFSRVEEIIHLFPIQWFYSLDNNRIA